MRSPITTLALVAGLAACPASAQTGGPAQEPTRPGTPFAGSPEKPEAALPQGRLLPSGSMIPEPTPAEDLKPGNLTLPDDPVEPYLLTKENGPFMVLAKVFRGPDCERMALALVKELRQEYRLPAFILRSKDFPGRSNIRGVPPTADPDVVQSNISMPEKVRTYDEAAVLVGEEKTLKGSEKLLHQVKKIKPRCLNDMPKLYNYFWREGLSKAIRTTNPMIPAQYLYPAKKDKLIVTMNSSPRSVSNCPGRFSLQIAEFSGRSTFNLQEGKNQASLRSSPLRTAADDAERLAAKLAKDPEIQGLGQPIYVYHDRTASRVYIGSFSVEKDPKAVDVRDTLLKLAVPLMNKKRGGGVDTMIVPAVSLTDLKDIKANFQ